MTRTATRTAPRAAAFVLAALTTLAVLGGIDFLAAPPASDAAPLLAVAVVPAA